MTELERVKVFSVLLTSKEATENLGKRKLKLFERSIARAVVERVGTDCEIRFPKGRNVEVTVGDERKLNDLLGKPIEVGDKTLLV